MIELFIDGPSIVIDYTNHRGERAWRSIKPVALRFGSTRWHREPQWLLEAYDLDKQTSREFALTGIHSFECDAGPATGPSWLLSSQRETTRDSASDRILT
jgi:predicted DNA-binding transcriptional regulator YafY